jgi:hypothetical protein
MVHGLVPAKQFRPSGRDHHPTITRDIGDDPQSRSASMIHIKKHEAVPDCGSFEA